jgi:protocatechuate 3,4-dioxygenase beta subunit
MSRTLFALAASFLSVGACFAADQEPKSLISVTGKVIGSDGKPVDGATVYLREWTFVRKSQPPQAGATSDILATAVTDKTGAFAFRDVVPKAPSIAEQGGPLAAPWDVIAMAKGYGLAWQRLEPKTPQPAVSLTLSPEARITGRLLDADKQPVEGVRVQGVTLQPLNRPIRVPFYSAGYLSLLGSQVPLSAQSGGDGRFELRGLPPSRLVTLVVQDERYARSTVYAATTDKEQPTVVVGRVQTPEGGMSVLRQPVHIGDFTVTLQPAHTLRVKVVFADTSKAAANASLREIDGPTLLPAVMGTDADGRLSVSQLAAGKYTLLIAAPEQSNYLATTIQADIVGDKPEAETTVSLPAGTAVTGQVVEEETGIGIAGVVLAYRAPPTNVKENRSFVFPTRTRPDGQFRIVVPAGKGSLRIAAPVPGYVTTDLPLSNSPPKEGRFIHLVDASLGKPISGMKFTLSRGLTLTLVLRDPDGKAVSGAQISGQTSVSDATGKMTLRGLDPQQRHEFIITHPTRSLAAKYAVPPSLDKRTHQEEVKLQATGSLSGRVLDEEYKPIPAASVQVLELHLVTRGEKKLYNPALAGTVVPDREGRFQLDRLPAGMPYSVNVSALGYTAARGSSIEMKSGDPLKYPDIVLAKTDQSISGTVVDPNGQPLAGVRIMGSFVRSEETEPAVQLSASGQAVTDSSGAFRMKDLPRGLIRMTAMRIPGRSTEGTLLSPTSFQVWSGQQNARIILMEAKRRGAAAAQVGKSAPEFPVRQWLQRDNVQADCGFQLKDFAGLVVLLAFLDEAKPSQRLQDRLTKLSEQLGTKGLRIVRVYEKAGKLPEDFKNASTAAAIVTPALIPGGFSQAFQQYGVRATPTLFVIDRQGKLHAADVELEGLEGQLEAALRQ